MYLSVRRKFATVDVMFAIGLLGYLYTGVEFDVVANKAILDIKLHPGVKIPQWNHCKHYAHGCKFFADRHIYTQTD